jgi:hypothetical protein
VKKGDLVQVSWTDAHFDFENPTYRKEYIIQTAGWVTRSDKFFVSVAQEITPDGHRGVTHIPVENIKKVVNLHG